MIGWTLSRYLSARFLQTIGAVFLMISAMIYVIDFVELLRRSGDIPGVSPGFIAYLSLLRVPSVTEQIMPFCVLFGTMATFLSLTRTLELLVARAVGVSVWGFLVPPLAIAVTAGIASVVLFNPLSATMKHRADAIETQLFGRNGKQNDDASLWIRQQGIDGEAFIKAGQASADGTKLTATTAYVYDRAGDLRTKDRGTYSQTLAGCVAIRQRAADVAGRRTLCRRHLPSCSERFSERNHGRRHRA